MPVAAQLPESGIRRSVALFKAFRVEQTEPDVFYSALALDTVRQVGRGIDPDVGELTARGPAPEGFLRASGLALPLADGSLDVCLSSNVLEHVPEPETMADEMLRVVRPGGLVWLSWTPWLSPWGGHETAPWHYLGGRRAADRYQRAHGKRPKNDYGRSLFAVSAARMTRWARGAAAAGAGDLVDVRARYHPDRLAWVARVPGAREIASWNVVLVVRRR